ncbi:MAG: ROK family protein [Erysipelotrichaceae bacterium]
MGKILCFDLGGSALKSAVLDDTMQLSEKTSFDVIDDVEVIWEQIQQHTANIQNLHQLAGIAISAPGSVDVESGIIYGASAFQTIHGPSFIDELEKRCGLAVSIENDANCAALAEYAYGAGKEYHDQCVVVVGTGVGGTIIKDGVVHHGAHLHGGEFGYMLLESKPHFKTLSHSGSIGSLIEAAKQLEPDTLWNGKKIFQRAQTDPRFQVLIDDFYHYLAMGMINVQYLYDPEVILLGGAISERSDFIATLQQTIKKMIDVQQLHRIVPTVVATQFGNDANLIGAGLHFKKQKNHPKVV